MEWIADSWPVGAVVSAVVLGTYIILLAIVFWKAETKSPCAESPKQRTDAAIQSGRRSRLNFNEVLRGTGRRHAA